MFDQTDYGVYSGLRSELEAVGVIVMSTGHDHCPYCLSCYTPCIVGQFGDFEVNVQYCEPKPGLCGVWSLFIGHGGQFKRLFTVEREDVIEVLRMHLGRPGAPSSAPIKEA